MKYNHILSVVKAEEFIYICLARMTGIYFGRQIYNSGIMQCDNVHTHIINRHKAGGCTGKKGFLRAGPGLQVLPERLLVRNKLFGDTGFLRHAACLHTRLLLEPAIRDEVADVVEPVAVKGFVVECRV